MALEWAEWFRGLVDSGWYGVEIVRSRTAPIQALAPIRADEVSRAPGDAGSNEFVGWWTRHNAERLVESSSTPLAVGRNHLFAPMSSVASAPPGISLAEWQRRRWEQLVLKRDALDELRA